MTLRDIVDTGDVVIGVKQENEYDVEVIGEFMSRFFNDVVYQTLVCGQSLVCGKGMSGHALGRSKSERVSAGRSILNAPW